MPSMSSWHQVQVFNAHSTIISIIIPIPKNRMVCLKSHSCKDMVDALRPCPTVSQFIVSKYSSDTLHLNIRKLDEFCQPECLRILVRTYYVTFFTYKCHCQTPRSVIHLVEGLFSQSNRRKLLASLSHRNFRFLGIGRSLNYISSSMCPST